VDIKSIFRSFKDILGWFFFIKNFPIYFFCIVFSSLYSSPYILHYPDNYFCYLLGVYTFIALVIGVGSFFLIVKGYKDVFGDYSFFLDIREKVKSAVYAGKGCMKYVPFCRVMVGLSSIVFVYFFHFKYFFDGVFPEDSYLGTVVLIFLDWCALFTIEIVQVIELAIISSNLFYGKAKKVKRKIFTWNIIIESFWFFSMIPFLLMGVSGGYDSVLRRDLNYLVLQIVVYSVFLNKKIRDIDVEWFKEIKEIKEKRDIFFERLKEISEEKLSIKEILFGDSDEK